MKSYQRIILAILSGFLLALSFPRFDLDFLSWICLVPLFLALYKAERKLSLLIGLVMGFTFFAVILYWLRIFGTLPYIALALYLSLFIIGFSLIFNYLWSRLGDIYLILIAPLLWTSVELIRSWGNWGFPWGALAYSQFRRLYLIQIADITGIYGVTYVIVLVNAALTLLLIKTITWRQKIGVIAGTLAILILVLGYGAVMVSNPSLTTTDKEVKVALVQANTLHGLDLEKDDLDENTIVHQELTLKAISEKPQIVVWAESALPFELLRYSYIVDWVSDLAKRVGSYIILGSGARDGDLGYNSAYIFSPKGDIVGRYDKIHLVPFGEYVPFKKIFPWILDFYPSQIPIPDRARGNRFVVFDTSVGKLAVGICYESVFPEIARVFFRRGAQILFIITNDAWFGTTMGPPQHASISTFRAIENRTYLVRVANTGISGIIDPKGRWQLKTELFERGVFTGSVQPARGRTFYIIYGDVFVYLCLIVSAILVVITLYRDMKSRKETVSN